MNYFAVLFQYAFRPASGMNEIFNRGRTIEQKYVRRQTLNEYVSGFGADEGRIAKFENDLFGRSARESLQRFRPIFHVTILDLAFDLDQLGLIIFKYFVDSEHLFRLCLCLPTYYTKAVPNKKSHLKNQSKWLFYNDLA